MGDLWCKKVKVDSVGSMNRGGRGGWLRGERVGAGNALVLFKELIRSEGIGGMLCARYEKGFSFIKW